MLDKFVETIRIDFLNAKNCPYPLIFSKLQFVRNGQDICSADYFCAHIISFFPSRILTKKNFSTVNAADIVYYFFNIQNPVKGIGVPAKNPAAIKNTHFNKNKETMVLVHGSGGNTSGLLTTATTKAISDSKIDMNVIAVDGIKCRNITTTIRSMNVRRALDWLSVDFLIQ